MGGPGPSEAKVGAILSDTFRAIRGDAPFLVGFLLATWALAAGQSLIQRALAEAVADDPILANAGLVLAGFSLVANAAFTAVFYQRAARLLRGDQGGLGEDVLGGLGRLHVVFVIGLILAAPGLVIQLYGTVAHPLHWPPLTSNLLGILTGIGWVITLVMVLNWIFAQVVAVAERAGPSESLGLSQSLISGHRMLTVGIVIIGALVHIAVLPVSLTHTSGAGGPGSLQGYSVLELSYLALVGAVTHVFGQVLIFQLYANLKFGPGRSVSEAANTFA